MSWLYERVARRVLFSQEAERAHERAMNALSAVGRNNLLRGVVESLFGAEELPVEVLGLRFPNPVGLAAGMDKHALAVPAWEALGFGFTELGGVTQQAQPGNPQPRLFRAIAEEAIVNRMGFNNCGAEAMAARLSDWRKAGRWPRHPVGINLGKSKNTPLTEAAKDYAASVRALKSYADFFVVNVSSPNTPNLRQLQDKEALAEILAEIEKENTGSEIPGSPKSEVLKSPPAKSDAVKGRPVLVKVSPDLSFEALDELLELAMARGIAGIVATNTTTERPATSEPAAQRVYSETGGLSGKPLRQRSTEMIRHIYRRTEGRLTIIGVGGIFSAADAWEKIQAGASLVQIYTGLIYRGPGLAKDIVSGVRQRLNAAGMSDIKQAIGGAKS